MADNEPIGFIVISDKRELIRKLCDFLKREDDLLWKYDEVMNRIIVFCMGIHLSSSYGFFINLLIFNNTVIIDFVREFGPPLCISDMKNKIYEFITKLPTQQHTYLSINLPTIDNIFGNISKCILPVTQLQKKELYECMNLISENDIVNNIKTFYEKNCITRREIVVFINTILKSLPYTNKIKIIFNMIYEILYTSYWDNKTTLREMENFMINRTVDNIQTIILYNEYIYSTLNKYIDDSFIGCVFKYLGNTENNVLCQTRTSYLKNHISVHMIPDIANNVLKYIDIGWHTEYIL